MIWSNYGAAVQHIEHVLQILTRESGIEQSSGNLCLPGWSVTADDGIMPALITSFYRLAIAVFLYGHPGALLQQQTLATSPRKRFGVVAPFGSIADARLSLSILVGNTLNYVADVSGLKRSGTAMAEVFAVETGIWNALLRGTLPSSPLLHFRPARWTTRGCG